MSENQDKVDRGPGSGAAKPVTDPPGGRVDQALNEGPDDPGVERGSRDPEAGIGEEPDRPDRTQNDAPNAPGIRPGSEE